MHAAEKAHVESCCEAKEAGHKTSPSKEDKDCACSKTPKVRDLSHAKVQVPSPDLLVLSLPLSARLELMAPEVEMHSAALLLHNHGPPRPARPLYHLDCSLLI